MNITIIRRALWLVAALALGYSVFALSERRYTELLISAGLFVALIPVDMLLAREERERRLPPHGPVRKFGYREDSLRSSEQARLTAEQSFRRPVIAGVLTSPPWWRRMYQRLPWWVAVLMLAIIPTIGALLSSPAAHAGPVEDDAYIATLEYFGVGYSTEAAIIKAGHSVCDSLDVGLTARGVIRIAEKAGWSNIDAQHIAGAAIGVYCAQYGDQLRPAELVAA